MTVVDVQQLSYAYGNVSALHDLDFSVPEGALYALLGPNASGKTTLLQLLMGLRRAQAGRIALFGAERASLAPALRSRISYIAEGQPLPAWMRIEQLEAYLAPLYPTWDPALASELRERFGLDPRRRIGRLSRGEHMKAALLCALAPRPRLLLMDEPFTGMDAVVKDDLVRGLLASSGSEGWSVMIASHDISELELLADWVGILSDGRMRVSERMDHLTSRFRRVNVVLDDPSLAAQRPGDEWLAVERAGRRLTFLVPNGSDDYATVVLPARFPGMAHVEMHDASLREIFVALARYHAPAGPSMVAA